MKPVYLSFCLFIFIVNGSFCQTTLTEDTNGILNATRIYAQTSSGQVFFQGHQIGSTYGFPYGIFRAITDNPTGVSNYFYDGVANGTTNFSVRADGQGYFAGNVGIGTMAPSNLLTLNSTAGGSLMLQANGSNIAGLSVNSNSSTWNGGSGSFSWLRVLKLIDL